MVDALSESLDEEELILLHLESDEIDNGVEESTKETSQESIVKTMRKNEKEIVDILQMMEDEDKISKNVGEEKTFYNLTENGEEKREGIWEEIKDEEIVLIDDKDTVLLKLKNIRKILSERSAADIIRNLDKDNILNLSDEGLYTRLVGRKEEMDKIEKSIEEIKTNSSKAIFVAGDTGIGKTRLVEELKKFAIEDNFDFLKGKCHLEEHEPYHPFKDALKKFLKIEREISEYESVISPSQTSEGKAQSQQMFDAQRKSVFYGTTKFLESLCEFRPLVLFLDDLQWADKGTLNLLDYMTDRLKDKPILIKGTYRPGDVSEDHPLKETMRRLSRKKLYEKMELSSLKTDTIKELIKSLTNVEEVPESFVESMEEKTNGNPLFIKENINQMIKEKLIDPVEGSFPDHSEIVLIPDVVQHVIEKRVYELDDKTREILQLGSVIGKKVPFELVVKASDEDELEILDKIDNLIEKKIWREHPREDSFLFFHDLFVDTIYDGVGKWLEQKFLHKKVAEAIESVYENKLEEKYSTLGRHYRKGEEFEKSYEYFKKAGEKAERVYSHEDAIERYKEGLKAATKVEGVDEEELFSMIENLGEATSIIGKYEESRKYFNQALTKTDELNKQRRMYRKIAQTWSNQGEFDKVISIADEGLNLVDSKDMMPEEGILEVEEEKSLDELDDDPEICNLLSQKGWALRRIGEGEDAEKIFNEELEKAKKIEDNSVLAQAYHDLGSLGRADMDVDRCEDYLLNSIKIREEVLEEKESFEDKYGLSRSYNNLGALYVQQGDLDDALKYFQRALELHQEIKNKIFEARTLSNIGVIYMKKGELEGTERILQDVFKILEKIGDRQGLSRAENNRGNIYLEKGRLDEALDHYESSLEISDEINDKFGIGLEYVSISKIYLLKGDLEKGEEYVEKAYELGNKIKNNRMKADALVEYGILERFKGNIEKAVELHEEGIELTKKTDETASLFSNRCELIEDHIEKGDLESARKVLEEAKEEIPELPDLNNKLDMIEGVLLREEGSLEEAEATLENCMEKAGDLSKRYRIARLHYELGKVYRSEEEGKEAKESLNKAKELFEEMGMDLMLDRSKEELKKLT